MRHRKDMHDLKELVRLHRLNVPTRAAARTVGMSRNTLRRYVSTQPRHLPPRFSARDLADGGPLWSPEKLAGFDPESLAGADPPAALCGLR
jgi:transposase